MFVEFVGRHAPGGATDQFDDAALARTGDMIVVVADIGWENLDGSDKMVRELIGKAVQRAGAADDTSASS